MAFQFATSANGPWADEGDDDDDVVDDSGGVDDGGEEESGDDESHDDDESDGGEEEDEDDEDDDHDVDVDDLYVKWLLSSTFHSRDLLLQKTKPPWYPLMPSKRVAAAIKRNVGRKLGIESTRDAAGCSDFVDFVLDWRHRFLERQANRSRRSMPANKA